MYIVYKLRAKMVITVGLTIHFENQFRNPKYYVLVFRYNHLKNHLKNKIVNLLLFKTILLNDYFLFCSSN